jgi:peptidyl-prolyl cis-trans isomerase C
MMTDARVMPATAPASSRWPRWAGRLLREPLTHFVIIGAVLFGLSAWETREHATSPQQIIIEPGDLQQLLFAWRAQGRPDPTPAEWQAMLAEKVHEEVLYREAVAMGLDKDDTIVVRRMAQKMDFLAEDLSSLREPTQAELQRWLDEHPDSFALPPRITLHHRYFSFDRHGPRTRAVATAAMEGGAPALGDRFMFQDSYAQRTPEEIAGVFGAPFAKAAFQLVPGTWSEPVESGYGWHLVFVDALAPGRIPDLSEIEPKVRASWVEAQRETFKAEAYKAMRAKYEVVLPSADALDAAISDGR